MDSNKANKSLNSELIAELLNTTKIDSKNDDIVDLERIFYRLLHRWYYFVIFLIITILIAYLYNRFTIPTYKVTSTLLFNNNDKNNIGSSLEAGSLMNGFGLNPGMQNMDNQINILSNYSLIKKCMSELPFDKEYFKRGKVNKSNLYPYSPFTVISDTINKIPYGIEFTIQFLSDAEFHISAEENDRFYFNRTAKFGEILNISGSIFHIKQSKIYWPNVNMESPYYFIFRDQEALIVNYQKRLTIEKMSREGTMVEISLEGINFKEDEDFLSKLINEYLVSNLRKKNYEADRTIKFIDNQLKGISDSLIIAENKLQEFRSRNRVMNISSQGSQVLEQAVKLEDEKSRLLIQADYYNYLNDYLSKESATNQIIAPSTMGISDPTLIQLVGQLSELQAEYLSLGGGEKNPLVTNLKLRIQNTREALLETLKSIIQNHNYAIDENKARLRELNREAEALPETERKLLGIQRGFELNDALYTFLMQKQAEAQIRKASNTSDTEVIVSPRILPEPVKPSTKLNYLIALFAGMAIPTIFIILGDALNNKIDSDNDLKNITGQPIAGHILQMKKHNSKVVLLEPDSDVAESFRSLRTRLQFYANSEKTQVILVTSSMAGEGKSFTAINIASAYSLDKKKTVLVDLDLRRPVLHKNFGLLNDKGISTYLIGKNQMEEIIHQSEYPNLDLMLSGPIPPNPAELINSERLDDLLAQLKKDYDYIIIDSTPIGIVADSFKLATKVDTCIYVVRYGKTPKPILMSTIEDIKSHGIKNLGVVVNGLRRNSNSSYSYRYKNSYRKNK